MAEKQENKFIGALSNFGKDKSRDKYDNAPAVLFSEAVSGSKFPQMLLFSQFGQANTSSLSLTSQITTHYTEENYHINDHWALEPDKFTLTGLIGEIIYRPSKNWSNKAEKAFIDYLKPLGVISPTFDSYTQSAINITNAVEESYRRYENIAKKALRTIGISENVKSTNQEFVISQLETLRENRQLVTIHTPYGKYTDMAIVAINANQENSKYQSSLEIQLQKWRTVKSKTRSATEEEKSMLAKVQNAVSKQHGVIGTTQTDMKNNSTFKSILQGGASFVTDLFN